MVEYYQWKESAGGEQLLKESGPLEGIWGEADLHLVKGLWLEFQPLLYGGEVNYSGQLMDGTPVKSTTSYVGFQGNLDLAYRIPVAQHAYIKPFIGVGGRVWDRSLDKSFFQSEVGANGYDEYWQTVYGIIGLGGNGYLTKRLELFGRAGIYLPVWNEINADLSANGGPSNLQLTPGKNPYFAAELGANYEWFTASLFVETLKFSQSATVNVDPTTLAYQPDSTAVMAGVKLGAHF